MAEEHEIRHAFDGGAIEPPLPRTPTADRVLETAMAFWQSAVLVTAHELGLFAALGAGPCDAGSLERRLGVRPDAITDLLDALLMLGLIERSGEQYRNAPEARLFLDPTQPSYLGRWLAMAGAAMRDMAALTTRLRGVGASEVNAHEVSASETAPPSLSDQVWADIAALLRTVRGHGDA